MRVVTSGDAWWNATLAVAGGAGRRVSIEMIVPHSCRIGAGYQLCATIHIEVHFAGNFLANGAHARGARTASRVV
jgi:hypothetical protein